MIKVLALDFTLFLIIAAMTAVVFVVFFKDKNAEDRGEVNIWKKIKIQ
jgi:hypothetical protein